MNYKRVNYKLLCSIIVNDALPKSVAIAEYIIRLGTNKIKDIMEDPSAYGFNVFNVFTIEEFKTFVESICKWNPLYKTFNPADNSDHEKLFIYLMMDFNYDLAKFISIYQGRKLQGMESDIINTLHSLDINSMDDLEDFIAYLEKEKGIDFYNLGLLSSNL